jgi:hypothetical protein
LANQYIKQWREKTLLGGVKPPGFFLKKPSASRLLKRGYVTSYDFNVFDRSSGISILFL